MLHVPALLAFSMDITFNRRVLQRSTSIQTPEICVFLEVDERLSVQKKCLKMHNCVLARK